MAKKQFKAESKKLLDLMINSIYTNKEIFLRELISNASDALDKLYYQSLQSGDTGIRRSDFVIELTADPEARTLQISDNGIGMTAEELEKNLGTIARSGSMDFKAMQAGKLEQEGSGSEEEKAQRATDIIGQFGVGFYSAFMVADEVTVTSRAYGSEEANVWHSTGADGYTVSPGEKESHGTDVLLHLKPDTESDRFSDFTNEYRIREMVRKYSDYIRYPIKMMVTKYVPKEDSPAEEGARPEMEEVKELETLNTMEPIWKRQKSKVKPEDYNEYYKNKFSDYMDPSYVMRTSVEGLTSYTALMFIPSHVPFDYYTIDYEKGLQLYSSGVLIMDKCKELLPDYFNFVRGLVDSPDLSLNLSREMLQQDRQLTGISRNLEKKIKRELAKWMKEDRPKYEEFFRNFGRQMKYGLYDEFGAHKDVLADLVLFYSSKEKGLVSLDEYIERMPEGQNCIYYASGETIEKIEILPQAESAKEKGLEVLYFTDQIDEFAIKMIREYKDKAFKSITDEDMTQELTDEEKEKLRLNTEQYHDFLDFAKSVLTDVSDVVLSAQLKDAAVCLTTKGELSLEMEKTINALPYEERVQAERVLELNADHPVMEAMGDMYSMGEEGKEKAAACLRLLYAQAQLISGLTLKDPVQLGEDLCQLITR